MSFVEIAALDGFRLAGTLFEPLAGGRRSEYICIVACATGISQTFYAPLAKFLAAQGITTLTFDYRFTGLSFPEPDGKRSEVAGTGTTFRPRTQEEKIQVLRQHGAAASNLAILGQEDIPGVIAHAATHHADKKLVYIGHSLGCHVLPLVPDRYLARLDRILWISATNPYLGAYLSPEPIEGWSRMQAFVDREGYFDGTPFGFGGLLTRGAFEQWYAWAKLPKYAADDDALRDRYARFSARVTAVGFTDDEQVKVSPRTLELWHEALPRAEIVFQKIDPGRDRIGHNDLFRARNQTWWPVIQGWVLHGTFDVEANVTQPKMMKL